jgi:hypothetical protein
MQCPKPLNREITEAEPVSCLSAMASAMLLGVGLLPPDARFTRSCAIDARALGPMQFDNNSFLSKYQLK